MKINRQFQDLHSSNPKTDWHAVQIVERDICLLYHQLADYSYVMGDLYYGDIFSLPYWDYLSISNLEPERHTFIRNGCLVMLYAMASDVLDGSGAYLTMDRQRYLAARAAIDALPTYDDESNRLIAAVRNSFKLIDENRGTWEDASDVQDVIAESSWIHECFVRQYFIKRANDFATNPYFRGNEPS